MQLIIDFTELLLGTILIGKSFDDFLVADGFVDMCAEFSLDFRLHSKILICALYNKGSDKNGKRRNKNNDNRDKQIDRKHEAQGSQNSDNTSKELCKPLCQPISNLRNIVYNAAYNISMRIGIDITQRNRIEFSDGFSAEIPRGVLYNDTGKDRDKPLKRGTDKQCYPIKEQDAQYSRKIHLPRPNNEVYSFSNKNWPKEGESNSDQGGKNRKENIVGIWF